VPVFKKIGGLFSAGVCPTTAEKGPYDQARNWPGQFWVPDPPPAGPESTREKCAGVGVRGYVSVRWR